MCHGETLKEPPTLFPLRSSLSKMAHSFFVSSRKLCVCVRKKSAFADFFDVMSFYFELLLFLANSLCCIMLCFYILFLYFVFISNDKLSLDVSLCKG